MVEIGDGNRGPRVRKRTRDLPADAVVKVDSSAEGGVEELAKALRSLLDDAPRRAALSARAAAALVSALGLGQAAADAEGIGRPVP